MNPSLSACSAAIALLLVAAPAQAQQQELTTEDVETYVEQIRQDAGQMMEAEDPQQLIAWVRSNFAEGATFQVSFTILSGDQRKAYSSMTLDGGDILRLVSLLADAFERGAFQDYSLDADVGEVTSHGPRAATFSGRWHAAEADRQSFSSAGEWARRRGPWRLVRGKWGKGEGAVNERQALPSASGLLGKEGRHKPKHFAAIHYSKLPAFWQRRLPADAVWDRTGFSPTTTRSGMLWSHRGRSSGTTVLEK